MKHLIFVSPDWKRDAEYFVQTRAAKEALLLLKDNQCVVVTGSSGSGKSSIIHHGALYLQQQGFDIHLAEKPSHIFRNFNSRKNQVFVLDDPFGKGTICTENILKWENHLEMLKDVLNLVDRENLYRKMIREQGANTIEQIGQTVVLISCRLNIYKHPFVSKIAKSLQFVECNLCSGTMSLSLTEKKSIFYMYVESTQLESICTTCDIEKMDYFPLLCMLSFRKDANSVHKLFENPPKHIREDIEIMRQHESLEFCCICLCVMFDRGFNLNMLISWSTADANKTKNYILNIICTEFNFDLNLEKHRSKIVDAFKTLNGSYCKEVGDMIVIRHDKIYDIAAKICGELLFSTYISYAHTKFISKRYALNGSPQLTSNDYLIEIREIHENEYFNRILKDIENEKIASFAFNDQLENEQFQTKLMEYIKTHRKEKMIQNALHMNPQIIEQSLADINEGFKIYSQFLFKLGVNKDHVLIFVCKNGNTTALEYLLTCDVNVNAQHQYTCDGIDGENGTPLLQAVGYGNEYNVDLLLQNGADVSLCGKCGKAPLWKAAGAGKTECLKLLLKHGADVSQCNQYGQSPLWISARYGKTKCLSLLFQHGADLSQCDEDGQSPLYISAMYGRTECLKFLLQHSSDVSLCGKNGQSPLFISAMFGENDCLKLLLEHGADISVRDEFGQSPQYMAAMYNNPVCLQLLLQHGADMSLCNYDGRSPLWISAWCGNKECTNLLLHNNADVSQCDTDGRAPLFVSAEKGKIECLELLLRNGADVSQTNNQGQSPLWTAARNGNIACLQVLLQHGADVSLRDKDGKSPLNISAESGKTECLQLLKRC